MQFGKTQNGALGQKGNFTLRGNQMISPGFLSALLHKEYRDEKYD
jgi:hypothetical protein